MDFHKKVKFGLQLTEGTVNEELWCSDATQNRTKKTADIVSGLQEVLGPKGFSINDDFICFCKIWFQTGGFCDLQDRWVIILLNGLVSNNWNVGSNGTLDYPNNCR